MPKKQRKTNDIVRMMWSHYVVDLTVESRTNSRRSADPSRQQRPEMDKRKKNVYHHCNPLCFKFSARTRVSRDKRLAALWPDGRGLTSQRHACPALSVPFLFTHCRHRAYHNGHAGDSSFFEN